MSPWPPGWSRAPRRTSTQPSRSTGAVSCWIREGMPAVTGVGRRELSHPRNRALFGGAVYHRPELRGRCGGAAADDEGIAKEDLIRSSHSISSTRSSVGVGSVALTKRTKAACTLESPSAKCVDRSLPRVAAARHHCGPCRRHRTPDLREGRAMDAGTRSLTDADEPDRPAATRHHRGVARAAHADRRHARARSHGPRAVLLLAICAGIEPARACCDHGIRSGNRVDLVLETPFWTVGALVLHRRLRGRPSADRDPSFGVVGADAHEQRSPARRASCSTSRSSRSWVRVICSTCGSTAVVGTVSILKRTVVALRRESDAAGVRRRCAAHGAGLALTRAGRGAVTTPGPPARTDGRRWAEQPNRRPAWAGPGPHDAATLPISGRAVLGFVVISLFAALFSCFGFCR